MEMTVKITGQICMKVCVCVHTDNKSVSKYYTVKCRQDIPEGEGKEGVMILCVYVCASSDKEVLRTGLKPRLLRSG